MKVINFAETPSLVGQYMTELRAVDIQGDMLRFRSEEHTSELQSPS